MNFPSQLKKTKARLDLFDFFNTHEGTFTVELLHELFPHIHIATLYRSVDEFTKLGVLRLSDDFNPSVRQYELNQSRHQHKLKCVDCGKEIVLETCPLHFHAPDGFVILDHRIEIEGLCKTCAIKRGHL